MRWRTAHNRHRVRQSRVTLVLRIFGPNGRVLGKKKFRLGKDWRSYQFGFTGPVICSTDLINETRIKAQATHG